LLLTILTLASCGMISLGLLGAWWRSRKPGMDDCWTGETQSVARDRLIIATICAMPLLMPFYFDYDLLLLAVPAVLLGAEMSSRSPGVVIDRVERVLVGSWIALFGWLMINAAIAGASGINVTVVLLNLVCWLSIIRAMRRGVRTETLVLPMTQRVVAFRAAA
jgi:hypothetical protein